MHSMIAHAPASRMTRAGLTMESPSRGSGACAVSLGCVEGGSRNGTGTRVENTTRRLQETSTTRIL